MSHVRNTHSGRLISYNGTDGQNMKIRSPTAGLRIRIGTYGGGSGFKPSGQTANV